MGTARELEQTNKQGSSEAIAGQSAGGGDAGEEVALRYT